mmetsp:Transcript_679/g.790  ORF Transcript_679/g.790 Transcript_679/m.790 type:complete len:105 (-) Transcript_679:29-343(-)
MDWNTHDIFVFVTAEFESKNGTRNQVSIWDDIIMRDQPKTHIIKKINKKAEYIISDKFRKLRGKTLQIYFNYVHMPVVGFTSKNKVSMGEITLPEEYLGTYVKS